MRTGDNLTTVVVRLQLALVLPAGQAVKSCVNNPATRLCLHATFSMSLIASFLRSAATALQLIQRGLFVPTTSVTITNWLGSCAVPCNEGEQPCHATPGEQPHMCACCNLVCLISTFFAGLPSRTACLFCLCCSARLASGPGWRVGSRAQLAADSQHKHL